MTGVNWRKVYYIFTIIRVVIGLINNESFRTWLLQYFIGTIIFAIVVMLDEGGVNRG